MSGAGEGGRRRLVVDRIEGDLVVVEVDGGAVLDLPRWLLPAALREGDVVAVSLAAAEDGATRVELRVDEEATRAAREAAVARLERLRAGDPGGDVVL